MERDHEFSRRKKLVVDPKRFDHARRRPFLLYNVVEITFHGGG